MIANSTPLRGRGKMPGPRKERFMKLTFLSQSNRGILGVASDSYTMGFHKEVNFQ